MEWLWSSKWQDYNSVYKHNSICLVNKMKKILLAVYSRILIRKKASARTLFVIYDRIFNYKQKLVFLLRVD